MFYIYWIYIDGLVVFGKLGYKVRWLKIDVYIIIYIYIFD